MLEAGASSILLPFDNSVTFGKESFLQLLIFKVKKGCVFPNRYIQLS
jgi:hypothetical protein